MTHVRWPWMMLICAATLGVSPAGLAQQQPKAPVAAGGTKTSATQAVPSAAPQRTETIVYGSWTLTCRDTVDGKSKKTCSGTLQVTDQKRGQVVFVWVIGRTKEGVLTTVVQTPTGVQIQKGVELKVSSGVVRRLVFVACESARCEASIAMDEALVKELSAGATATATIYAIDGRGINFNMPISGIDKIIASLGK